MSLKEENFLNIISETLTENGFLGDDCAYLKEYNLAVSTDALIQDVHFSLDTISPYDLGKKAVLVNVSDILASGAKPEYLTVSLSGNLDETFVKDFYLGINEICKRFNLKVIGGDLTGGEKISIGITVFGNTKNRNVSSRKNAKPGYIVLLAGEHGSSAIGFSILTKKQKIENSSHFIKAHIEPELHPEISAAVALKTKDPYVMMDTSDGLYDALKKVSEASGAGFEIEFNKIQKQTNDFNTVMFGGEDYGLLICVSKADYTRLKEDFNSCNVPVIGVVTENKRIITDNKEVLEDLRYEHF